MRSPSLGVRLGGTAPEAIMIRRFTRRWRMLHRDTQFAIMIFSLQLIGAVLIIAFLPPLLRGGLPICQP